MSRALAAAALAFVVTLGVGCSQQRPAERAVDAAEQALADIHETALKYLPKEYAEVKAELDAARKALQDGKYADAIAAAKNVPAKATQLAEAAAAARDKLAAEIQVDWTALKETMPGKLAALEARVGELARARRLPKGVAPVSVEQAPAGLSMARQAWTDAEAAYEKGNVEGAVARGRGAEGLVAELMESLMPRDSGGPAG